MGGIKNTCKNQAKPDKFSKPGQILKTRNPWKPKFRSNQEVYCELI